MHQKVIKQPAPGSVFSGYFSSSFLR